MRASDRHSRYPFGQSYARNSAVIVVVSIVTMLLLTYPRVNISLYENTVALALAFASAAFCTRYIRFRKIMHPLMTKGRVLVRKPFRKDTELTKVLAVGGVLLVLLLPVMSIRFMDPLVWLSALLGYIMGLNLGEFAYYLFIRRMERSTGQVVYVFDSEDPITQERIMGYRLEKIGD